MLPTRSTIIAMPFTLVNSENNIVYFHQSISSSGSFLPSPHNSTYGDRTRRKRSSSSDVVMTSLQLGLLSLEADLAVETSLAAFIGCRDSSRNLPRPCDIYHTVKVAVKEAKISSLVREFPGTCTPRYTLHSFLACRAALLTEDLPIQGRSRMWKRWRRG